MTAAVEYVEADCAVPACDEFTIGHESPVMPGLTENGQLVRVTLQWCPKHAAAFDLVLVGFSGDLGQGRGVRPSDPTRRFGHDLAVAGLISA